MKIRVLHLISKVFPYFISYEFIFFIFLSLRRLSYDRIYSNLLIFLLNRKMVLCFWGRARARRPPLPCRTEQRPRAPHVAPAGPHPLLHTSVLSWPQSVPHLPPLHWVEAVERIQFLRARGRFLLKNATGVLPFPCQGLLLAPHRRPPPQRRHFLSPPVSSSVQLFLFIRWQCRVLPSFFFFPV
jgi:hypothetical protein